MEVLVVLEVVGESETNGVQGLLVPQPGGGEEGAEFGGEVHQGLLQQQGTELLLQHLVGGTIN